MQKLQLSLQCEYISEPNIDAEVESQKAVPYQVAAMDSMQLKPVKITTDSQLTWNPVAVTMKEMSKISGCAESYAGMEGKGCIAEDGQRALKKDQEKVNLDSFITWGRLLQYTPRVLQPAMQVLYHAPRLRPKKIV